MRCRTAGAGASGSTFFKSGTGSLALTGAFGMQTTAPVELDVLDAADFITTGLYNGGGYNPPPSSFAAASVAAVPEPVGLGMVGMGGMGFAIALLRGRHRRRP